MMLFDQDSGPEQICLTHLVDNDTDCRATAQSKYVSPEFEHSLSQLPFLGRIFRLTTKLFSPILMHAQRGVVSQAMSTYWL